MDLHCFDADPKPDPGGGGRSAKNVHPPRQNPRYALASRYRSFDAGGHMIRSVHMNSCLAA